MLGHLDVARDRQMRVTEWAINAPTLTPVGEGRWVLLGARSQQLVRQLRQCVEGVAQLSGSSDDGVLRVEVSGPGLTAAVLRQQVQLLNVDVLAQPPALTLARALPHLSAVERALTRTPVPSFRSLELWDSGTASWQPASSLATPGAYRLRTFGALYVVRSRADLHLGTLAVTTPYLAKHIASLWAADPLARYHHGTSSIIVPLGADLPGLYGRAAALCSGRSPAEHPTSRLLQYLSVPADVANVIHHRLTH